MRGGAAKFINSLTPFHAEPSEPLLLETYVTPNEIFYTGNHGPVPVLVDPFWYDLELSGLLPKPSTFYQDAVFAMPKSRVPITLMCEGNRRSDMHKQRKLLEVPWDNAALGTGDAIWGGVRPADFLKMQGIPYRTLETEEGGRHAEFISLDYMKEAPDEPYKSSIPPIHATTPDSVNGGRSWEAAERRQGSFPVPRPPCPCCGAVRAKVESFDPFEADGKALCLKDPQLLRWTWVFWELVAKVNPPTEIIVKAGI